MTQSELYALINLLDDDQIYDDVRKRLVEHGKDALPYLREVLDHEDMTRMKQAREILREIHNQVYEEEWIEMLQRMQGRDLDLERATWLLAQFAYPALDVSSYREELDIIADEVRERIRITDNVEERIRRMVSVLANNYGFTGNADEYYDPDNTFMNRVIDRRLGIPIALSTLYLMVAKRLGLPLAGVGIPSHFMLKYEPETYTFEEEFYIDVFHHGRILGRMALERFCIKAGLGFQSYFVESVTNADIVERMMRNLVLVYTKNDDNDSLNRLQTLLDLYAEHYADQTKQ